MAAKKPATLKRQAREKTAIKTAPPSPISGVSLPVGNHPGNTGGKKGRSGRKPDAFKRLCRALASGAMTIKQVKAILGDAKHPSFVAALKWATEHGYGKPKESLEVSGKDGGPIAMTVRFVK